MMPPACKVPTTLTHPATRGACLCYRRGWDTDVRQAVARPSVVAGSFTFGVNRKSFNTSVPLGIGTMEVFANFRSKHFMLPYGDQVNAVVL